MAEFSAVQRIPHQSGGCYFPSLLWNPINKGVINLVTPYTLLNCERQVQRSRFATFRIKGLQICGHPVIAHFCARWTFLAIVTCGNGSVPDSTGQYPSCCERNAERLDPLSTSFKLNGVEGSITKVRNIITYNLRGVMEICCYSPHSKTNALIDCIYHSQAPYCPLLSPADSRRRASKVAQYLCPDRVQELAGYPLNGRPSAVTMLELLYNGVARYDDLSILK